MVNLFANNSCVSWIICYWDVVVNNWWINFQTHLVNNNCNTYSGDTHPLILVIPTQFVRSLA